MEKIKEFLKVEVNSGSGYGSGSGSGYGYGSGYGIKSINNNEVYNIDGIETVISSVRGNIAKGFILNKDLTFTPCFVVKGSNKFAHGETLKQAFADLESKIFNELDVDEKIKEFHSKFKIDKKYLGSEFYKWHNLLTGSCEMGRKSFVANNGLSLDSLYTVEEFINICKDAYGGEIIRRLEEKK